MCTHKHTHGRARTQLASLHDKRDRPRRGESGWDARWHSGDAFMGCQLHTRRPRPPKGPQLSRMLRRRGRRGWGDGSMQINTLSKTKNAAVVMNDSAIEKFSWIKSHTSRGWRRLIWRLPAGEPVLSEIITNSMSVFSSVFWVRLKRSGSWAQLWNCSLFLLTCGQMHLQQFGEGGNLLADDQKFPSDQWMDCGENSRVLSGSKPNNFTDSLCTLSIPPVILCHSTESTNVLEGSHASRLLQQSPQSSKGQRVNRLNNCKTQTRSGFISVAWAALC